MKRAKAAAKPERTWTFGGVMRRSVGVGTGLIALGVVAGSVFAYGPLRERVGALRAGQVRVGFEWPALAGHKLAAETDPPATWLPAGERQRLEQIVRVSVSADPFDVVSLEEARRALQATGWFADGPTVRRRVGGEVEIEGAWRIPAAVVRHGSVDRLVSRDGRLLRLEYPAGRAGDLRVITGAWAGPPKLMDGSAAFGAVWLGGDVEAAGRLLELLRQTPAWRDVAGVDVSQYAKNRRMVIITAEGALLTWGSPPGEVGLGEQLDGVKLTRLVNLLKDPLWINAGRPPADLYTPYVMINETAGGG